MTHPLPFSDVTGPQPSSRSLLTGLQPEAGLAGTVLLIEDDPSIQRSINFQLSREGYRVRCCGDGERGLEEALHTCYDVLLLDIMLPKLDGLHICQQVRRVRPQQMIVMVSARDSDLDRITGLEYGADDYLGKPFSPAELVARLRALRRRAEAAGGAPAEEMIAAGGVVLDCARHELRAAGMTVRLTPKELHLLRLLMSAPGRVFTRENLLAQVWGSSYPGYHRAVDAHITRLRAKLGAQLGAPPTWLEGVYGAGYRFTPPAAE